MPLKTKVVSILVIALIAILPHLGYLPNFSYSIPLLLAIWGALRMNQERFADIGFRWKGFGLKALGTGLLAGVIVFTLLQVLLWPFVLKFIEYDSPDVGIYDMAQSGLGNLILIICLSWIVAGLYEEIAFHGFIFTRLEKMISGKNATALSFWITALIFGLYHYQLGTLGWVNAFMAGAVYLGLFLYFKRNLWYATICHGTYNTLVFVFIYNGWL